MEARRVRLFAAVRITLLRFPFQKSAACHARARCHVGKHGVFCKHLVAVVLKIAGTADGFLPTSKGDSGSPGRLQNDEQAGGGAGETSPPADEPPTRPDPIQQSAADSEQPSASGQQSAANLPADREALPLMPVRRLNNFVWCPRLFYLQWVENLFEENADTIAGSAVHRHADRPTRVDDAKMEALKNGLPEGMVIRSLRLESVGLGLCGVVDIVEGGPEGVELVDYKKGAPRRLADGSPAVKGPDAVQLAAYALLLKADGARVAPNATVYYAAEKKARHFSARRGVVFPRPRRLGRGPRRRHRRQNPPAARGRRPLPLLLGVSGLPVARSRHAHAPAARLRGGAVAMFRHL
jgi:CRISPR/Cas system-associated exonuclease Cas4 (RecB family)